MISDEQFYMSLFAIDSYARGYDSGLRNDDETSRSGDPDGLGESPGTAVGEATIILNPELVERPQSASQTFSVESVQAGFYALAYRLGPNAPGNLANKVVISYRGTDSVGVVGKAGAIGEGNA